MAIAKIRIVPHLMISKKQESIWSRDRVNTVGIYIAFFKGQNYCGYNYVDHLVRILRIMKFFIQLQNFFCSCSQGDLTKQFNLFLKCFVT